MALVLTALMVRLGQPVAAEIVNYFPEARAYDSGNEFGHCSTPLIHEVRRGGRWCAGGVVLRFDYDLSSSESLTVHLTKRPL